MLMGPRVSAPVDFSDPLIDARVPVGFNVPWMVSPPIVTFTTTGGRFARLRCTGPWGMFTPPNVPPGPVVALCGADPVAGKATVIDPRVEGPRSPTPTRMYCVSSS
jgi:hypothetical protein